MPMWLDIVLGGIGAIAAIASAVAAWFVWQIAKAAFTFQKEQLQPCVIVRTYVLPETHSIIYISIENVGKGFAYDISFSTSRPIKTAFGAAIEVAEDPEDIGGAFEKGIAALAPGDKRVMMWGQYGGLYKWLGDGFVAVDAHYVDKDKQPLTHRSALEVRSYFGNEAGDNRPITKISKSLEQLVKATRDRGSLNSPLIVEGLADANARRDALRQKQLQTRKA